MKTTTYKCDYCDGEAKVSVRIHDLPLGGFSRIDRTRDLCTEHARPFFELLPGSERFQDDGYTWATMGGDDRV